MFQFVRLAAASAGARGLVALAAFFFAATSCLGATSQAAAGHGLALLPGGQVAGWGANEFGQVQAAQGDFLAKPRRLQWPSLKLVAVAAGGRHSLAVDETGKVWAWGDNSSGQLGLGHTRPVVGRSKVTGLASRALAVAAGAQHSAALLADGSVWVWGANNRGQLGNGVVEIFSVRSKPARVAAIVDALALAAGDDFVVALLGKRSKNRDAANLVWGWGAGNGMARPIDGIRAAVALRAAGAVAMVGDSTGHYWRWRINHVPPTAASRQVFDRLGEMTHPMLGHLAPLPIADTQPHAAKSATIKAEPIKAATIAADVIKPKLVKAVVVPERDVVAVVPDTLLAMPAPARVSIRGTVLLADAPLENVQVAAEGAQCTLTDRLGHYVCDVAAGWSGRVSLRRKNFRFSPNALSYKSLQVDAGQQDFTAIYEPR